ncbi:zinc-binding dehydrogenase [Nonomuraea sp. NPDC005701]|uniref:zinc-binding dehydrogenase n=1 Tax=Nonomuraea sp. NPDC005701 TaxID=3157049 RepID=UPI0033FB1E3F
MGQLVVQYAVAHGASRVVAVDTDARRLDLARTSGASDLIAATAADARAAVADLTGGRLAEVVFDVTGNPAVLSPGGTAGPPAGPGRPSRRHAHAVPADARPRRGQQFADHPRGARRPRLRRPVSRPAQPRRGDRVVLPPPRLRHVPDRRNDLRAGVPLDAASTYARLRDGGAPAGALCFDWTGAKREQ